MEAVDRGALDPEPTTNRHLTSVAAVPLARLSVPAPARIDILRDPLRNKGTAFTQEERTRFGLHGLLPPQVETLEEQVDRAQQALTEKTSDLERYIYLRRIQDTNETLFYALVASDLPRLMPIIYTPVVGEACRHYSTIYRSPRGLYISYPLKDQIGDILENSPIDDPAVIVVTDGERILGLGDQGVGGMGIPIGKLSLYTACGGIDPARTLPVILDVGTNNRELLDNPLYIGCQHERLRGAEYDEFVDAFVSAVKRKFPNVLLQWEDFAKDNATRLLEKYRGQICSFNDDIQGTAAVATGSLIAAVRAAGSRLAEQRVVIVGAGSAGCGIAAQVSRAMMADGLGEADALGRFYMVDKDGLLRDEVAKDAHDFQKPFVRSTSLLAGWTSDSDSSFGLLEVIRNVEPTILIGVSGQPGLFSKEIVEEMARHCERPIILPLTNPTSRAEGRPSDILEWTGGKAIVATGSPFPPVSLGGREIPVSQCNNSYLFPGLGLGVVVSGAKRVTDGMLMAAAITLGESSPMALQGEGPLLPPLEGIAELSKRIALAVAMRAQTDGVATSCGEAEIRGRIDSTFWTPRY